MVAARFRGSLAAYRSALRDAGVTPVGAREIVGDELQARDVGTRLAVQAASAKDISRFRETYAAVPARRVEVSPAPTWLPTGSGVALATTAPHAVFTLGTGQRAVITTAEGRLTVEAFEDTTALGGLPADLARPAVVRELRSARQAEAYAEWSIKVQKAAQARLVCERDRLPELSAVRLSAFAPFLSLHEAEASSWLLARQARSG
jgi:hypothetical protein